MLQKRTLQNGLQVITYDMPSIKSVHVSITVKGGSIVDEKKKSGLAHYMEHMLVQGIPSMPDAQQLSTFIESLSGVYNAYTSGLTVQFFIRVPYLHIEDAMKIASEVFFAPLFPEASIEKERTAVLNEITQELDSRWFKFNEFFRKTRFTPKSVLHNRIGGTVQTVKEIQRTDLLSYWQKYFTPKNTYVFIGGHFSDKELDALLDTYFGSIPVSHEFSGFPTITEKDFKPRQVAVRRDMTLKTNYIDLSFPTIGINGTPKEHIYHFLAQTILGRLRSSRLFRILRYEKGLVYDVSIASTEWPEIGYSMIYSEVLPESLEEVTQTIVDEVRRFMHDGPTQGELDFAKNFLTNQWLMAFDNPHSIAGWVEGQFLWHDKILLPEDDIALLESVTTKDIREHMQKYWNIRLAQLIIQGPLEASEANQKKFETILEKLD